MADRTISASDILLNAFLNAEVRLIQETREHWPQLSEESARMVADCFSREYGRLTDKGDRTRARIMADEFDAGIALRDLERKYGLGIPGKIILESEGMVLGGGSGSG